MSCRLRRCSLREYCTTSITKTPYMRNYASGRKAKNPRSKALFEFTQAPPSRVNQRREVSIKADYFFFVRYQLNSQETTIQIFVQYPKTNQKEMNKVNIEIHFIFSNEGG